MRREERLDPRITVLVLALALSAAPCWAQTSIDDLSDAATPGDFNLFLGTTAEFLTTGFSNTAVGLAALENVAEGLGNTATGAHALHLNTSGNANTATGTSALGSNTTGFTNTATGYLALADNTEGDSNTATGMRALFRNTTGSRNVAFGNSTLDRNKKGSENTALGWSAMAGGKKGSRNTAVGVSALLNTLGEDNVAIGYRAGAQNKKGHGNVFIGADAGNNSSYSKLSDRLVIANSDTKTPLIDGNFKNGTLRVNGDVMADDLAEVSDARLKTEIAPLENALPSVLRLEAKTFRWRHPRAATHDGREIGLIAQEVEAVLPELVSGAGDGYKGIEYGKLTAVLVEAIKEQQAQITTLLARVEDLERQRAADD